VQGACVEKLSIRPGQSRALARWHVEQGAPDSSMVVNDSKLARPRSSANEVVSTSGDVGVSSLRLCRSILTAPAIMGHVSARLFTLQIFLLQLLLGILTMSQVVSGSEYSGGYPMDWIDPAPACLCDSRKGQGFSSRRGVCEYGSLTGCNECENMEKCATIHTIVGDGLRSYDGDCKYARDLPYCIAPHEASISLPIQIVYDENDNLFIADSGNNRVRMVSKNIIRTIAGTGETGFSGDGGLGRLAKLRFPEGLAIMKHSNSQTREVFISDFLNQRIRRVRQVNKQDLFSDWIIDTVAGNGKRGDSCEYRIDSRRCHALHTAMNNPRALAFASSGELYIVDSGNRKIQRLDLTSNTWETYVGSSASDDLMALEREGGVFLAGSWSENNLNVVISAIYTLAIDGLDQLWFMDAANNRIFKTPLIHKNDPTTYTGIIGQYQAHFKRHFGGVETPSRFAVSSYADEWLNQAFGNLTMWLKVVDGIEEPGERKKADGLRVGYAYWHFATPVRGEWCTYSTFEQKTRCKSVTAQFAQFHDLMGMCFDIANEMYVTDMEQSEILFIGEVFKPTAMIRAYDSPVRSTTRGCPCLKNWVYWFDNGLNANWPKSKCGGTAVYPALKDDGTPNLKAGQSLGCTATNYCKNVGSQLEWCYVNTTGMGDQDQCIDTLWGYCTKAGGGIEWQPIKGTTVFGNEKRTKGEVIVTRSSWLQVVENLGADLWVLQDIPGSSPGVGGWKSATLVDKWAVLLGFRARRKAEATTIPNGCSDLCCGLPELGRRYDYDYYGDRILLGECAILSLADVSLVDKYLPQTDSKLVLYFDKLGFLSMDDENNLQDCQEQCALDDFCSSFMVSCNKSSKAAFCEEATPGSICVFFNENYPYDIYPLGEGNRGRINVTNLNKALSKAAGSNRSAILEPYLMTFGQPFSPRPRVGSSWSDATVGTRPMSSFYNATLMMEHKADLPRSRGVIEGPVAMLSLRLRSCEERCILTPGCTAVAFPGCYLLNATADSYLQQDDKAPNSLTMYLKKHVKVRVSGVTGLQDAYAFQGDNQEAPKALLNRPSACAVDSKGDMAFADTWNMRIRKISSQNLNCQYLTKLFAVQELKAYAYMMNRVEKTCHISTKLELALGQVEMEAVDSQYPQPFTNLLCRREADDDSAGSLTNSLYALCHACKDMVDPLEEDTYQAIEGRRRRSRPPRCPSEHLCECRASFEAVLKSPVYLNCPSSNLYFDRFHRLVTTYVACFMTDASESKYVSEPDMLEALQQNMRDR